MCGREQRSRTRIDDAVGNKKNAPSSMIKSFPAAEKVPADAIVASDCAMISHDQAASACIRRMMISADMFNIRCPDSPFVLSHGNSPRKWIKIIENDSS